VPPARPSSALARPGPQDPDTLRAACGEGRSALLALLGPALAEAYGPSEGAARLAAVAAMEAETELPSGPASPGESASSLDEGVGREVWP
jgi:hypothetical protein